SGGLRIVDIADPAQPTEVGHFIPEPTGGEKSPQSNDVDVDARGLVYLLDRNRGLDILEFKRS
ncbi:MAG: RNA polymerase subunit sigma-70, partial [Burkholderiales bacterium]|nr:RNA polymerase subunit sigma-70 [Burkholderiales bacterium]